MDTQGLPNRPGVLKAMRTLPTCAKLFIIPMNRSVLSAFALLIPLLTGCGSSEPEHKTVTVAAGEKANVEKLSYSIADTQLFPRLGDPANPRVPTHRFYVVNLSVFNSGSSEQPIPALTLIDDSGKNYEELIDGTGVPHWLGVSRRLAPHQTEQGAVVFDAPAGHYKLRLTDETDDSQVFVDLPLSFAHEQLQNETDQPGVASGLPDLPANPPPVRKK
jgi:hypothetical protein